MNPAADFARDGFALVPEALAPRRLRAVERALRVVPATGAGTRTLLARSWCRALADELRAHPAIAAALPAGHVAVQCTSFEKTAARNWLVTLHQDLSIPVAERVDDAALAGWSRKEEAWFVQPPPEVLATLVAIRLHVDACGADDGPLQVVPGSHVHGRFADADAFALRTATPARACLAAPGDALLMRPLALHASSKAGGASRRRVLHFVFGPRELPFGLRWALQAR